MRKYLVIILLLLATIVRADCTGTTTGSMGAAAASDCTGTVIFSAHFENNDDITVGTPAGCSAGDTTATKASLAAYSATWTKDGSYSLSLPTSGDYLSFTVSGGDIFSNTTGTIDFWVYLETESDQGLFRALQDSTNYLDVYIGNTDEIRVKWACTGQTDVIASSSAANVVADTAYHIVVKYNTADVDPNLQVGVYNASDELISSGTSNTNIVAWSTGAASIRIGETQGQVSETFIDNLHIHSD